MNPALPPPAGKPVTLSFTERQLVAEALRFYASWRAQDAYVQALRPCAALAEIEGCRELADAIEPVCQAVGWP